MMSDENMSSERQTFYTLEELLAQCKPEPGCCEEDREWLDAKPVGRELI